MYRQFCKNLKNFLVINETESENYRYKIGKELEILTNIDLYNQARENNDLLYMQASNFIFEIQKYKDKYPSIKKFLWELWGYGFDEVKFDSIEAEADEKIEEKVKLIDLLWGTHYWG